MMWPFCLKGLMVAPSDNGCDGNFVWAQKGKPGVWCNTCCRIAIIFVFEFKNRFHAGRLDMCILTSWDNSTIPVAALNFLILFGVKWLFKYCILKYTSVYWSTLNQYFSCFSHHLDAFIFHRDCHTVLLDWLIYEGFIESG